MRTPRRTTWAVAALYILLLLGAGESSRAQSSVQRIYIANDDHTDYYWSATGDEYRAAFLQMLDYYMDLAEDTASLPSDQRSRFNTDGSLWLREYEHHRSAAEFQRLISHVQAGNISVPLQSLVLLPGAMPAEAFLRDMYYAGSLERRFGLDLELAGALENQTLAAGAASLWAGAGARYSWYGVCDCVTQVDVAPREAEIYAFRGKDGRSVIMKWNSLITDNRSIGGYAEARDPIGVVQLIENDPSFASAWPYRVAAAFGHGWDDLSTTTDQFVQTSQSLSRSDLRVIVSNEVDFFEDFLAEHRTEIPVLSGSLGNEWDLLTASLAAPTARLRRAVERLRTAEALAALLHDRAPQMWSSRAAARESAHMAMGLYYEHAWTADGPVTRPVRAQWQRDLVTEVEQYVDGLFAEGLNTLADSVRAPSATGQPFAVFNPLGWLRTDVVDLSAGLERPVHVVDLNTGQQLRSQWLTLDGLTRLRVLVQDLPAVGYRVLDVREGAGAGFSDAATVQGSRLESSAWIARVEADGRLSQLVDKANGSRELAGAGGINRLNLGQAGTWSLVANGPVSAVLRVDAGGSPAHRTYVTLHEGIDRVEIDNRVVENFGGTLGFDHDFALTSTTARHEELGTVVVAARRSEGGDYFDQNTRTDYLSSGHFVDFSEGGYGVTVSDPDASFFRLGDSTINFLDANASRMRSVVGMQVDGPGYGFVDQDGHDDFLHRFAIGTHGAFDPIEAMRFSLEHQNPLVGVALNSPAAGTLPSEPTGFVEIDQPDLLLWALKPAEDPGAGEIVARIWNLAGASRFFSLEVPGYAVVDAFQVTHIESHPYPASASAGRLYAACGAQALSTWQLDVQPVATGTPPETVAWRPVLEAYPNPFNPRVELRYRLERAGPVQLRIFDAAGRLVRELEHAERTAGWQTVVWEGEDAEGLAVASGVYHAHLATAAGTTTAKLVLAR